MKFEEACEAAMEYFKTGYGDTGLCSIKDLGDRWLFNGANGEEAIYGKQGIAIVKDSGKQELFYLPDISNFKLLDSAVNIEIPVEYRL
ncbi:hypothetical protein [Enterocloster bolteae]|uniref:hypothetical protein n=1 Tax=Enterocloster bolteae TaxID=208479 RepID=UPI003AEF5B42